MRCKIALMILFLTTALVLHVTAQNKPAEEQSNIHRPLVGGQETKTPVALCTGPTMAIDGTAKCLYQALPVFGKLRIEMQDGIVHEIDLQNVRKMTVNDL